MSSSFFMYEWSSSESFWEFGHELLICCMSCGIGVPFSGCYYYCFKLGIPRLLAKEAGWCITAGPRSFSFLSKPVCSSSIEIKKINV